MAKGIPKPRREPDISINYTVPSNASLSVGSDFKPTVEVAGTTSGANYEVRISEDTSGKLGPQFHTYYFVGNGSRVTISDFSFARVVGSGTIRSKVEVTEVTYSNSGTNYVPGSSGRDGSAG